MIGGRKGVKKELYCCECASETEEAVALCVTCKDSPFCQVHMESHQKSRRTCDHQTRVIKPAKFKLKCTTHQDKVLQLYCFECDELICKYCALFKHRTHVCNFIPEAISFCKKDIIQRTDKLTPIIHSLEESLKKRGSPQQQIATNAEEVTAQINDYEAELKQVVKDVIQDLRNKVVSLTESMEKEYSSEDMETEYIIEEAKDSMEKMLKAVHDNAGEQILCFNRQYKKELEDISASVEKFIKQDKGPPKIVFVLNQEAKMRSLSSVAQIVTKTEEDNNTSVNNGGNNASVGLGVLPFQWNNQPTQQFVSNTSNNGVWNTANNSVSLFKPQFFD